MVFKVFACIAASSMQGATGTTALSFSYHITAPLHMIMVCHTDSCYPCQRPTLPDKPVVQVLLLQILSHLTASLSSTPNSAPSRTRPHRSLLFLQFLGPLAQLQHRCQAALGEHSQLAGPQEQALLKRAVIRCLCQVVSPRLSQSPCLPAPNQLSHEGRCRLVLRSCP